MSELGANMGLVGALVDASLRAADPAAALRRAWVGGEIDGPCRVVSVGKAASGMMRAVLEQGLCEVESALVIGPPSGAGIDAARVRVREADHPLASARNVEAARECEAFVRSWSGPLAVLLSGGASAMLMLPAEGLALEDCRALTKALLRSGATIQELNCVRKHVEQLKGGGLARAAGAASIWTFVMSDVIGDDLSTIGSGPTCADATTYAEALAILERYGLLDASPACTAHLRGGAAGRIAETVKPGDAAVQRVRHRIICNNAAAVEAAAGRAAEMGFRVIAVETGVTGEASHVGAELAGRAIAARRSASGPVAIVMGGETTVTVRGEGTGGRNQELALAAALRIGGEAGVVIGAWSTDGVDGMTDAAGAVAMGESVALASARGVDAAACLAANDSHRFFGAIGGLITTGRTGTNVNDVAVALVTPEEKLGG